MPPLLQRQSRLASVSSVRAPGMYTHDLRATSEIGDAARLAASIRRRGDDRSGVNGPEDQFKTYRDRPFASASRAWMGRTRGEERESQVRR